MSQIDFYILPDTNHLPFVCRLIEKAYKNRHSIFIHANNQAEANHLDELLWTYRDDSFLPHNLYGEGPDPAPPIQIGYQQIPEKHRDILINLNNTVPTFYKQFSRVLELVANQPEQQHIARERYRFYQAEKCKITSHKL